MDRGLQNTYRAMKMRNISEQTSDPGTATVVRFKNAAYDIRKKIDEMIDEYGDAAYKSFLTQGYSEDQARNMMDIMSGNLAAMFESEKSERWREKQLMGQINSLKMFKK